MTALEFSINSALELFKINRRLKEKQAVRLNEPLNK